MLFNFVEFVAKFACSFLEKEKEKNNESQKDKSKKDGDDSTESMEEIESDEEEEEMPKFMHRSVFLKQGPKVQKVSTFINAVLKKTIKKILLLVIIRNISCRSELYQFSYLEAVAPRILSPIRL